MSYGLDTYTRLLRASGRRKRLVVTAAEVTELVAFIGQNLDAWMSSSARLRQFVKAINRRAPRKPRKGGA